MSDYVQPNQRVYCHKPTMFGYVLMVRYTVPDNIPGEWVWGKWRKANFAEYGDYLFKRGTAS